MNSSSLFSPEFFLNLSPENLADRTEREFINKVYLFRRLIPRQMLFTVIDQRLFLDYLSFS